MVRSALGLKERGASGGPISGRPGYPPDAGRWVLRALNTGSEELRQGWSDPH